MRTYNASYGIWVGWLALFLVFELIPVFWGGCPWSTLSGTSQHAERAYPIVRALVFGFMVGLLIHISFEVKLWSALVFGYGFTLLIHFVHFRYRV